MILDRQERLTLWSLVRERHAYVREHQAPQVVHDELTRLENKLLPDDIALRLVAEDDDDEVWDETENEGMRGVNAFEARADGSLVLYATLPDGDGEPIRVEPHRVGAVLAACGDALARTPSTR